jgi:hypothetical protein
MAKSVFQEKVVNHFTLSENMNLKTVIILILFSLQLFIISLSAQTLPFEIKITGIYKNIPLKDVLTDLTKKTSVRFSYSPKKIPESEIVSGSFSNKPLNEVLDYLFNSLPVKYELIDDYIILKKGTINEIKPQLETTHEFTLSGYIKDSKTGEFLLGAAIFIKELNLTAIVNNYGFFSLTIPPGRYTITISYIGYDVVVQEVNLVSNTKVDFKLMDHPQRLEEVIVSNLQKEGTNFKLYASQSEVMPSFV